MSYGSNKEKSEYDYGKNMSIKYCQLSSDSYIPYWCHIRYWIQHEHRFSAQKCYSDISKFANRCFPTWIMNKEVRNGKRINRMKGKSEFIFKKKKRPICATLKQPNSYYAFDHCTLYFENVIQMYVWNWDMTEFITVLRLHRMYAIDK